MTANTLIQVPLKWLQEENRKAADQIRGLGQQIASLEQHDDRSGKSWELKQLQNRELGKMEMLIQLEMMHRIQALPELLDANIEPNIRGEASSNISTRDAIIPR